jgi:hypothetical protein
VAHDQDEIRYPAVERAAEQIVVRVSEMFADAIGVARPDSLQSRILAYADLLEGFEPTGLIGPMGVAAQLRLIVQDCTEVQL